MWGYRGCHWTKGGGLGGGRPAGVGVDEEILKVPAPRAEGPPEPLHCHRRAPQRLMGVWGTLGGFKYGCDRWENGARIHSLR